MRNDLEGKPIRILITCDVQGDTRRYRSLHLLEQLRWLGVDCVVNHISENDSRRRSQETWSMVIIQRAAFGTSVKRIIHNFRSQGALILSDFDDLIFDVDMFRFINSPDFADPIRAYLYQQNMENYHKTLASSDGCLVSTDFLANHLKQAGTLVWVHRNAFSLEMWACSEVARRNRQKKQDERIVIGYASGTPTHNKDFELVKPALIAVMQKYSQVDLRIIGALDLGEGWGNLETRIQRIERVTWRNLPHEIANFDINLAPLVMDNPFSQSKSEIKWMEAAMVTVPTIACPVDAFSYAIQHGKNGWLANDEEAWREGLSCLIEDDDLRKKLSQQAYQDVQCNYHPAKRALQLAATLNQISLALRGRLLLANTLPEEGELRKHMGDPGRNPWIPAHYEKDASKITLGYHVLRNMGSLKLLLYIWVYFRRLLAPIFPFRKNSDS